MRATPDALQLSYRHRRNGGEWQDIEERVPVVRVRCRFGGTRPYFVCPGVVSGKACGRRVVKLYGADRYFLCRHCYRLPYASQNESEIDRVARRANNIRMRLGGEPGLAWAFPVRPKGMWRRTYDRLYREAMEAEEAVERAIDVRFSCSG